MISIPTYSQLDPRWKDMAMSPSPYFMRNHGCFVTAVCMALGNYAIEWTPGEFLRKLVAADGIDAWGQFRWDAPGKVTNGSVYFHSRVYTDINKSYGLEMRVGVAVDRVRRLLDLGQPVCLHVDAVDHDSIPDHMVTAYDYVLEGDEVRDFKIIDPWGGKRINFSEKYGEIRKGLYGYAAIIGPSQTTTDGGDIRDAKVLWKASQIAQGIGVETYSKEIIDTFL